MKQSLWVTIILVLAVIEGCAIMARAEEEIANGSADVSVYFPVYGSVSGDPCQTDATTSWNLKYYTDGGSARVTANATVGALNSHTDNSVKKVGDGLFQADFPDTCFDGGVGTKVHLWLTEDSNAIICPPITVKLIAAVSGYQTVTIKDGTGAGELDTSGGNLAGSVGSISGVTFPANFGAAVISAGGIIDSNVVTVKGAAPMSDAKFRANVMYVLEQAFVDPNAGSIAAIAADWLNGGRLDLILDQAAIDAGAAKTAAEKIDTANELRAFLWGHTTALRVDSTSGAVIDANDLQFMPHGESVSVSAADVWTYGTRVLTAGTNLNDLSAAQVNAEVDTALADYDPPTRAELASDKNAIIAESNAVGVTADAIKLKTDNLPADPASETNVNANETKIDTLDTVVDAIKLKTDNLPADPADDSDLDTSIAAIAAWVDQIESWLGSPGDLGGGATIAANIRDIAGPNSAASYDPNYDSQEAIRDRGDAAWTTGGAGSISDILNIQALVPNAIDLADTATVRIALGLTNMVDDLPSAAEVSPGTITIDRKATGGTSWTNIVDASACSEAAGLVYYDEVFDANSGYAAGDTVRIAFKGQKIAVAGNDYEITGSDGWIFHTYIRTAGISITHYSNPVTE